MFHPARAKIRSGDFSTDILFAAPFSPPYFKSQDGWDLVTSGALHTGAV